MKCKCGAEMHELIADDFITVFNCENCDYIAIENYELINTRDDYRLVDTVRYYDKETVEV